MKRTKTHLWTVLDSPHGSKVTLKFGSVVLFCSSGFISVRVSAVKHL